jgi:crotonobetainyl-CoA:carnitine CoA-transferase CaiB-like acyl-CoA transferase
VIQAEAGLMSITGPADGEPHKVGVALADIMTGQNAAIAILAALRARETSGRGQLIDLSLFDTQLQALANVASSTLFTGEEARRYGNAHPSIVPYQAFRAADRWFALAVASPKLWVAFCAALGRVEWIDDPRYRDNAARVHAREQLVGELEALFATQPAAHWLDRLAAAQVPCAPINGVRQALDHPLARARDMRIGLGDIELVASPLKLSATPVRYARPPPRLGEHGDEIVRALGFDPVALRGAGVMA